MRFFYFFLLLGVLLIAVVTSFSTQLLSSPQDEANTFVTKIKAGDVAAILREFGDNTCHCAPKGGYIAYLQYESGENPNLAFLLRQRFQLGSPVVAYLKEDQPYIVPWEKPESTCVDLPLNFNLSEARPLFLPLPMAYGHIMSVDEFEKFLQQPGVEAYKGFALRLRPSLNSGLIASSSLHKSYKPAVVSNTIPHAAKNQVDNQETTRIQDLLPKELTAYVIPKDPVPVILPSGKHIPLALIESKLPRLYSVILRLYVVRRGQLKRWTIKKLRLLDPVLVTADGKLLKVSLRPKAHIQEPATREPAM